MTTLHEQELADHWKPFLEEYCSEVIKEAAEQIESGHYLDVVPVTIQFNDVEDYDEDLAHDLQHVPGTSVPAAESAIAHHDAFDDIAADDIELRVEGVPTIQVREVTHEHLNSLISIDGVVRKATDPKPRFTELVFECQRCGATNPIKQSRDAISEPHECRSCERQGPFQTVTTQSSYIHHQRLRVQETPEGLRGGQDPRSIDIHVEADLVDMATPGDEVTITGVLTHPDPVQTNGDDPVVTPYLTANYINTETDSMSVGEITDEEEAQIKDIADGENPTQTVVNSIAPTIYGNEIEKLAIALQMFSGVRKKVEDKTIRGDLHVFLVGDPGTAKSQLLHFVNDLMPRASYTTGEGSSKVGLTGAAVQSDLGDGTWTIEAGVLVLSDKGIACVDELDKLEEGTDALHSALEQQKVSIAKAGINTSMNARCGLLAAANPKYGRWDEYEPIPKQVALPPAIISRFDLIFTLQDTPDPEFDSELAESILDTNQAGQKIASGADPDVVDELQQPEIPFDLLPKYIMYAREEINPVLTSEAKARLQEFYVDMRSKGVNEEDAIPVTARKLEALVRLAEASARIRLSNDITVQDAELSIDIVEESLKQVGVDPETGEYDTDMLETGTPKSQRDRIKNLKDLISDIEDEYEDGAPEDVVEERAREEGFNMDKFDHELKKLKKKGDVYEPKQGHLRSV